MKKKSFSNGVRLFIFLFLCLFVVYLCCNVIPWDSWFGNIGNTISSSAEEVGGSVASSLG